MEKVIKVSRVTKSYGFSIYPDVREKQAELAHYYNMSLTKVVMELIEEKHSEVFGESK